MLILLCVHVTTMVIKEKAINLEEGGDEGGMSYL